MQVVFNSAQPEVGRLNWMLRILIVAMGGRKRFEPNSNVIIVAVGLIYLYKCFGSGFRNDQNSKECELA